MSYTASDKAKGASGNVNVSSTGVVDGDLVLFGLQCGNNPFDLVVGTLASTGLTLSTNTVGAGRTATAGAATFVAGDVGSVLYGKSGAAGGVATITAYTSSTVVTVTITTAFFGTTEAASAWLIGNNGWALVDSIADATNSALTKVYSKVAGASEPANYGALAINSSDTLNVVWSSYAGRSGTVAAVSSENETRASTPRSVPATGITAVANDDLAIFTGGSLSNQFAVWTLTQPSGWNAPRQTVSDNSNYTALALADNLNVSAGATGTLTETWTADTGGYQTSWSAIVVRMEAAGGAPARRRLAAALMG